LRSEKSPGRFRPGRTAQQEERTIGLARIVGLWFILFAVWLLLSGHWDSALLVGFGLGSCTLTVYIASRMDVADHEGVPIYWIGRFLLYLPWLLKEILVANINVAKVILSPKLPISPIMVVFRSTQKSDLGRVLYANSITLTPGTITTGVEGDQFEIHALTRKDVDGREEDEMGRRVSIVEGAS
jgi:multicomponent Na+:H+ antiporter subunit E